MQTLYEISYLLSPALTNEEARGFATALETKIGEQGGIVKEAVKPSKTALAYPIKKQTHAWTGDVIFGIEKEREKLAAITSIVAGNAHVLRSFFTTASDALLGELRRRKETTGLRTKPFGQPAGSEKRRETAESRAPAAGKEEKTEVKMEDVEKKIEELLE